MTKRTGVPSNAANGSHQLNVSPSDAFSIIDLISQVDSCGPVENLPRSRERVVFTYVLLCCNIARVKTMELLGQAVSRDGTVLKLMRRGDEYIILANGKSLMSSRMHGSEEALATFACRRAQQLKQPRVLIGGLGMGFTLRAALDLLPPDADVVVAEIVPAVIEWNRGALGPLAEH